MRSYEEVLASIAAGQPVTEEEVFTHSVLGIIKQGSLAGGNGGMCFYRGVDENGRKIACSVGQLIPDEEYISSMEDMPAYKLITMFYQLHSLINHTTLLQKLQQAHDMSWNVDEFVEGALEIAEKLEIKVHPDITKVHSELNRDGQA